MPQILAVTTQGHYTGPQRDVLRADIMRQLEGCDAVVLILPPGVQLQNTFLPAAAVVVPRKVETNDIVRPYRASDEEMRAYEQAKGIGDREVQYVDAQCRPITKEQNDVLIAARDAALGQREVQHIDVPEEEPAGIPPHVWLYRNMLTDLQALAPLGRDETNGQYAVAIDQLTDEQRAIPHVARQLVATYDTSTRSAAACAELDAQLDAIVAAEKLQAYNKPT